MSRESFIADHRFIPDCHILMAAHVNVMDILQEVSSSAQTLVDQSGLC